MYDASPRALPADKRRRCSLYILVVTVIIAFFNHSFGSTSTIYMHINKARARITGAADIIVKTGSSLTLTCVMSQGPHNLGTVNWYRGDSPVTTSILPDNDIETEPRIMVETEWSDALTSRLKINRIRSSDSGNYSCVPTAAKRASVNVHVINEKNKAVRAAQRLKQNIHTFGGASGSHVARVSSPCKEQTFNINYARADLIYIHRVWARSGARKLYLHTINILCVLEFSRRNARYRPAAAGRLELASARVWAG
uniref:Ig-like domain-containing protein n=1 Tax=Trichogramma kaykai TaxID=54128 RepID=A0ABD2WNB2_9HYME